MAENHHVRGTLVFFVGDMRPWIRVKSETSETSAVEPWRMVPATFLPLYLMATSPTRNWASHADVRHRSNYVREVAKCHDVVDVEFLRQAAPWWGRTPMTGKWNTQKTLEPSELTKSATRLLRPLMTEEMVMTVVTPNDDAEDGESRAKLVYAQRIQRHLYGFAGLTLGHKNSGKAGYR